MRCTSYDLLTRQVVDDVPFSTFSFSDVHCTVGPGGWQATIADGHEKAAPGFLAEERHAVIFTADKNDEAIGLATAGRLLFAGILWDLDVDPDTGQLRVGGQGLWSYFRDGRRNFRGVPPVGNVTDADDFGYESSPEQFNLVKLLMVFAQSGTAENLGLDTRFSALSGVTRTGTLKASELKGYADVIEDWAFADDGFDFAISGEWINSQPRFHLDLYHPEKGSAMNDPWRIGSHVKIDGKWKRTTSANLIDAVGATIDGEPLRRSSVATPSRGLRIERVISYTDVTDGPTLKALANGELRRANRPAGAFDVKLLPDAEGRFGTCSLDNWSVGDTTPLVGPVGRYTNTDRLHRIMGYELAVDEDKALTVKVDLEPAE
jgi:hypothetical protein